MEQILKDQQTLAKKMELIGQEVAKLTINQMEARQKEPASPTSSEQSEEPKFQQFTSVRRQDHKQGFHQSTGRGGGDRVSIKNLVPKKAFPRFAGANPCI